MPNHKRAVQAAPSRDDSAVKDKPEPPPDLWDEVDRLNEKFDLSFQPEISGFTYHDYAKKYGLTRSGAVVRLMLLVEAGELNKYKVIRNGKCVTVFQIRQIRKKQGA